MSYIVPDPAVAGMYESDVRLASPVKTQLGWGQPGQFNAFMNQVRMIRKSGFECEARQIAVVLVSRDERQESTQAHHPTKDSRTISDRGGEPSPQMPFAQPKPITQGCD